MVSQGYIHPHNLPYLWQQIKRKGVNVQKIGCGKFPPRENQFPDPPFIFLSRAVSPPRTAEEEGGETFEKK